MPAGRTGNDVGAAAFVRSFNVEGFGNDNSTSNDWPRALDRVLVHVVGALAFPSAHSATRSPP